MKLVIQPFQALIATTLALASGLASAQLIRPDSATASSSFSASYDIGNAIDGSGLPANFTLADPHAVYSVNNHWTTAAGAIAAGTANATFSFAAPQTISQFHLWNHQSNGVASNNFYAITQFDLVFYDVGNNVVGQVLDVAAVGGVGVSTAQTFGFATFNSVSSILLRIDANSRPLGASGSDYTGLAEVAFSAAPIPEASSWAMMMLGLAGLVPVLRRRGR